MAPDRQRVQVRPSWVALHPALRTPTTHAVPAGMNLAPAIAGLLAAAMVLAATIADLSETPVATFGWLAAPIIVAAVVWAWIAECKPSSVQLSPARPGRRAACTMVDRRPVLLRPLLILSDSRGSRIVRKLPRRLVIVARRTDPRLPARPRRRPRLILHDQLS